MQSKYFFFLFILLLFAKWQAGAQNLPTGQTVVSGSITATISLPDEVDPNIDPNYVRTYVPILPSTSFSSIGIGSPVSQVRQIVAFKDGFNRTFQTVEQQVATVNGQAKHLIKIYDNRFRQEKYSFLPYGANGGNYQYNAFQAQKSYYSSKYPDDDYTAYSHTSNTSTTAERSITAYLPGKSQTGQGRGTVTRKITNFANQIRTWDLDANGLPISTGFYAANELSGDEALLPGGNGGTINAASPSSREYTDKEGRTVLKMMADSNYTYTEGGLLKQKTTYQSTYYVYDEMGRLIYILPPRAVELIENNGWVVSQDVLDNLCYRYTYDSRGQKVEQKIPGKALELFVYDNLGRMIFYQESSLRQQNKWQFTIYDRQSRPVCTGLYQEINATRQTLQGRFTDGQNYSVPNLFGYLKNYNLKFDYPSAITASEILSYNYYDHYNNSDPGDAIWATFSPNSLEVTDLQTSIGAENPLRSPRTEGMLTGTRVKILPSPHASLSNVGEWRRTAVYYDDKGRVIYTADQDLYQGSPIHEDYTSSQFDFAGRLLINKHIHSNNNAAGGIAQHIEWTKNEYDPGSMKLLNTRHKVDQGNWNILSSYFYDDMGRVIRKILGNGGEVQDFTYNIRGQLNGINGDYAETGSKGGVSRSFGEALKYDYGFTKTRYDGRVTGMIWRGSGPDNITTYNQNYAYGYDYDQSGRLKTADFRAQVNTGSTIIPWSNASLDYSVSNLFYDKNGNILSMKQRGVQPGTGPVDMDVLSYRYTNNNKSNQLLAVSDAGVADYGAGDFQNNGTGSSDDYFYDGNGNLSGDGNKGISGVAYHYFNKPYAIPMSDGKLIEYSYDATGEKIQELVMATGVNDKRTDYQGNFIYQNDSLDYILTGEGRTIVTPSPGYDSTKEEYFVKDHLGNVRSTVDVVTYLTRKYLATWEVASANLEGLIFDNLNEVRDDKPGSTDPGDLKSGRLNGAEPDRRIGTSLLVKMMAGDKISFNVNNYFDGSYKNTDDQPVAPDELLGTLASTLTGGGGGFEGSESHDTKLVDRLFTTGNYTAFQTITDNATDAGKPRAYLNYMFFDENMKLVPEMSGAFQANGNGTWQTIGTAAPMAIPVNGFMAVYLSNSSNVVTCGNCSNVFFDLLWVEVSKGNLLEETHYYPHGLPITGISSMAADGFKEQRHKYQSNEYIKDLGLNWMDFQARQYDPQTGRFLGVDPLATTGGQEKHSPYAAMGNMPEGQVDPNGTIPIYFSSVSHVYSDNSGGNASGGWSDMPVNGIEAGGTGTGEEAATNAANGAKMNSMVGEANDASGNGATTVNFENGEATAYSDASPSPNDGDQKLTSSTENGMKVYDKPSNGIVVYDGIKYNLTAFEQFYDKYGQKFDANALDDKYIKPGDVIDAKGNNVAVKSEAGTYLTIENGVVTVGENVVPGRKGTSLNWNHIWLDQEFQPKNYILNTLHTHPLGTFYVKDGLGWRPVSSSYGPSPRDFVMSTQTSKIRSVIVDARYIYLVYKTSEQTITIKR